MLKKTEWYILEGQYYFIRTVPLHDPHLSCPSTNHIEYSILISFPIPNGKGNLFVSHTYDVEKYKDRLSRINFVANGNGVPPRSHKKCISGDPPIGG